MDGRGGGPSGRTDRHTRDEPADRRRVEADALADPTRYRVFTLIERAGGDELDVAALTRAAGVHHTVVRQHLARLRDAGLVVESTAPPLGRGRPRLLYAVHPEVARRGREPEQYRRLAGLLAEALRRGVAAREMGRLAGVEQARAVAEAHEGGQVDPLEVITEESAAMGFEPEVVDSGEGRHDVVLHHCPFRDVAAEDPETICSLHLGIADGIAAEVGGVTVEGITIRDPYRAGCRLHLRDTDASD
jgi:predicted ArsR family transcriptional regulator